MTADARAPELPLTAVVDLDAVRGNLRLIRRAVSPGTEVIACVKANAYGHGLLAVARLLEAEGVRWLSLGSPGEALSLRRAGIAGRILLFPTALPAGVGPLVAAGITIGIQSWDEAVRLARAGGDGVSVFLKVDSGLGRVGVVLAEAPALARRIVGELPSVALAGVFTHLPFHGVESLPWVEGRLMVFGQAIAAIRDHVPGPLLVQALASAGIACGLEAPEANAVCPGQLLFGLEPGWAVPAIRSAPIGTRPALVEVRTTLGALRHLEAGARFGIGGARTTAQPVRLAVLPIGYADSILVPRPGQTVRVGSDAAPVLSVSLEHAVADVTGVPGAREGAPAILLSREAPGPSLEDVARRQDRTPLEVLVSLTGRAAYAYVGATGAAR